VEGGDGGGEQLRADRVAVAAKKRAPAVVPVDWSKVRAEVPPDPEPVALAVQGKTPPEVAALVSQLNERQRRFLLAYRSDVTRNATAASKAAGYNYSNDPGHAKNGCELLQHPKIAECMRILDEAEATTRIMSERRRKEFLSDVIEGRIGDPVTLLDGSAKRDEVTNEVETIPAKARDRVGAVRELNAMDGAHAPTRVADPDGKPLGVGFVEALTERLRRLRASNDG
jgi:phage terminase small subunit